MALRVGMQQPPLPQHEVSAPLVMNYLDTPHATLSGPWRSSGAFAPGILLEEDGESYLRFVRTGTGIATLTINEAALDIPSGTFDLAIWLRVIGAAQTGCTVGMRRGTSQAPADNLASSPFTANSIAWSKEAATLTLDARTDWTFIVHLAAGAAGDIVDVKLASIMPNGQAPVFGDQKPAAGTDDFYYWEGATNASKSIYAHRTLTNTPGPSYAIDNLTTYAITENATPLTPADTSGGATTTQFGVQEYEDSILLAGGEATLYDGDDALVQGRIDAPTSDGSTVSITSMSIISRLNVVRRVPPFRGSLDGYIAMLLAAVGVDRPLTVDLGIAERPVAVHGFKDNVLSKVKEFCASQGVELSDKGDGVYLRQPRERDLDVTNATQLGRSSDSSSLAKSIEVINYNSQFLENVLVYPPASYDDDSGVMTAAGWTPDVPILTVDSGAVTTYEVPIIGSLVDVEQPTCVKVVGPDDGAAGSVYTVIGQGTVTDGSESIQTLDPDEWTSKGGSVTVKVGDNYDTLVITITSGENERLYAPYAIAMNAGSGTYYSSLRIRGTGVVDYKEKITYPTGLTDDDTSTDVGATIDTPYVQTREMADRVAAETLPMYGQLRVTVSGAVGDPGLPAGDVAGSRFPQGDSFYRVTQAVTSEGGVGFTATADTTMEDVEDVWGEDATFDDFDAVWEERTFAQFGAAPMLGLA